MCMLIKLSKLFFIHRLTLVLKGTLIYILSLKSNYLVWLSFISSTTMSCSCFIPLYMTTMSKRRNCILLNSNMTTIPKRKLLISKNLMGQQLKSCVTLHDCVIQCFPRWNIQVYTYFNKYLLDNVLEEW